MSLTQDEAEIVDAEERIFDAIRERDLTRLADELTEDFLHTPFGNPNQDRDAFLRAIAEVPYKILELSGEDLRVRILGEFALLSGYQRAKVQFPEGAVVEGVSAFVDLFVGGPGAWRLRHAFSIDPP
jgi:ketosteroid isomerase-like protein